MESLWKRLVSWHAENASDLPFKPRPPTTEKEIAAAETKMGLAFPADFRASLLVHDGEEDYDDKRLDWMPGCDRLAPLAEIVKQWEDEQDRVQDDAAKDCDVVEDGRFRNVLWHSKRIPIAGSPYWDQDNTYLDLVPGPNGIDGQLVTMTSECDFTVLDSSFRAAFQRYIEALESGAWVASTSYSGPRDKKRSSGHPADAFAKLVTPAAKAAPAPKTTTPPAPKKKAAAPPAKKSTAPAKKKVATPAKKKAATAKKKVATAKKKRANPAKKKATTAKKKAATAKKKAATAKKKRAKR